MKILLDVCTPVQVRAAFEGHEVHTAVRQGWGELENGDLLDAAEAAGYEVLVVCDKNMRYQQNLSGRRVAIIELWTNHRPTLERHWPTIGLALKGLKVGEYRIVEV
jgi:predicted nuclease of predicted toxin-antitoxin system